MKIKQKQANKQNQIKKTFLEKKKIKTKTEKKSNENGLKWFHFIFIHDPILLNVFLINFHALAMAADINLATNLFSSNPT